MSVSLMLSPSTAARLASLATETGLPKARIVTLLLDGHPLDELARLGRQRRQQYPCGHPRTPDNSYQSRYYPPHCRACGTAGQRRRDTQRAEARRQQAQRVLVLRRGR